MERIYVDFYAGTFRWGFIDVPLWVTLDLMGRRDTDDWNKQRPSSYWRAVDYIEEYLAHLLFLEYKPRNLNYSFGENRNSPVKTITFKRARKLPIFSEK